MFYFGDPTFIFLIPALILAFYAQAKVQSAFHKYSQVPGSSGLTGAEVARRLLSRYHVHDVAVEPTQGMLSDHYDPQKKVLRLSPQVYDSTSIAALGIAAHEAGHAMQHAQGYKPLVLRTSIVPLASIGSQLAFPLFFLGFLFGGRTLMDAGIILFTLAVVFQLITLPVEYNASSRAIKMLHENAIIGQGEVAATRNVLSAAALTYVAATAMAAMQLLRLLFLRGSRND
ncbi:MAG: zinc metallopeptidase [Firmicutes bacterium]|nr:zinc metallopeptidase [Bacillota bacterium]HQD39733.1 zinc metallopeptidase [Bacillota bacterium]